MTMDDTRTTPSLPHRTRESRAIAADRRHPRPDGPVRPAAREGKRRAAHRAFGAGKQGMCIISRFESPHPTPPHSRALCLLLGLFTTRRVCIDGRGAKQDEHEEDDDKGV